MTVPHALEMQPVLGSDILLSSRLEMFDHIQQKISILYNLSLHITYSW